MPEHLNPFWVVWCEDGGTPVYKHWSVESAKAEAERLANLNPGKTFVILMAVDVTWTVVDAEIPF